MQGRPKSCLMRVEVGALRRDPQPERAHLGGAALRRGAVVALLVPVLMLVLAASAAAFTARGSVEQVYATGLESGAQVSLLGPKGETLAVQNADALGGVLFRHVAPGKKYRLKLSSPAEESGLLVVHSQNPKGWGASGYHQTIPSSGYGYLTTRDGTQLAIDVHPPGFSGGAAAHLLIGSAKVRAELQALKRGSKAGAVPTLIEYAGYGYANPKGPESGIAQVANLMGFAVVDVNMRGTGCSGGAFDYFEPLQNIDAYDVIETIAHQPWVLHHKVGMFGISYGGISQLFAAQLKPPALAAIAPLSVIDATASTLYPGGILNTGFAVPWGEDRQFDAEPAGPSTGEHWAYEQIQKGDATCAANQDLHEEATDLHQETEENATYNPAVADALDPDSFVHNISVPTFMACQFEDEQTGGHCADLVQHFTGTSKKWFTFTNGAHIDSLDPYTFDRVFDFLQLFVARKAPGSARGLVEFAAPTIYSAAMGLPEGDEVKLPADPIAEKSKYSEALAAFSALPEVRVLFDNGAGESPTHVTTAGNPYPAYEKTFSSLPVPGTTAQAWYLAPNGELGESAPASPGSDSYTSDASAGPGRDYSSNAGPGGLWGAASQWEWNWAQPTSGDAVSYVSAPLASDTTVVGAGAVNLWVKSSTPDVDLQATVSEVRPDGNESFVQNGWLRASERKLSTNAENIFKQEPTALEPIPTLRAADVQPMPAGEYVPLTIPLYYEGHAYRAGSHIRVTISAPNGSQPVWSFSKTQPEGGTAQVSIGFGPEMPSNITLPVVPGVSIPTPLPPCPSLRNEPCRAYQAYSNNGS